MTTAVLRRILTEPARPARIRDHRWAPWLVVGTVCAGAFMGQLDASIVTLALPRLRTDLGISLGAAEWVSLSYLVALVALLPAAGWLADRAGRKLLYTYGFALFSLASLGCGLAPGFRSLLALRVAQAAGAALLQANSIALISTTLGDRMVSRGIGIQGAAQALGLALGPVAGGLLVAAGGWRLVFLVNVPVGFVGCALGWLLLPRTRERLARSRFDVVGLVLSATATSALLLGLSLSVSRGWHDPEVLVLLSTAAGAGAVFVRHEGRTRNPLLDRALIRQARIGRPLVAGLLVQLTLFGLLYAVPLLLERGEHAGPVAAGLTVTVLPAALAAVAPWAGAAKGRRALRLALLGGPLLLAVGLAVLGLGGLRTPVLVAGLVLAGAGIGAFVPLNNATVMAAAGRPHAGLASGLLNTARGLGTSLGVAVSVSFVSVAGIRSLAAGLAVAALAAATLALPPTVIRWPRRS